MFIVKYKSNDTFPLFNIFIFLDSTQIITVIHQTADMTGLNNTIFPFLSLPGEIRNIIYEHLLIGGRDATANPHTQILRTCKQVNHEATGILYAENVFKLFVNWHSVLAYKVPLFSLDQLYLSADIPDFSNVPPFFTDIPLQRVEKLEVHIRGLFKPFDPENLEELKLTETVLRLCRHWPKHHALKELSTFFVWHPPVYLGPDVFFSYPPEEAMVLEPFSELQNIQSVTIRGSMRRIQFSAPCQMIRPMASMSGTIV
ncbi:MAG: hypothetical protein FRX48_00731 [Lasallia pustulata]|uniref:F-box domain-containing protein n=1 Tax=Lasallia pustulata TaxID=136370 RepID=A0A5M8Q2S3_9LECA|nr:MAG: hypothetical protein FRX48_00731 [Lasallia pustulata]